MVSQILYGESFEITETRGEWQRIRLAFDGYEGWCEGLPYFERTDNDLFIVTEPFFTENNVIYPLGSHVRTKQLPAQGVIQTALLMINAPYLWGGRTFMGIDCSGFTQVVFKANGVSLPRDASQQVHDGTEVDPLEAQAGDLAFFVSPDGKVTHVGIVLDDHKIIHASKFVRIDKLSSEGIIDPQGIKTHSLFKIKRVQ